MRQFVLATLALFSLYAFCVATRAADIPRTDVARVVDSAVQPMLRQYHIPGMAVGVVDGKRTYVLNYGMATTEPRKPVTGRTLFELGSVSKTLTATLTAYAAVTGRLSLSDTAGRYLSVLRRTRFGDTTLLELGTHTPGGLPLQVPDDVHGVDGLMRYFAHWRPSHPPGTYRTYSNLGIGALGLITAKSMGADFDTLMARDLLPALGMRNTFLHVPAARMADYAEGYASSGSPIRMKPRVLWSEAYGIKTTAADMVRFLQANIGSIPLDPDLERAVTLTHTGWFQAGAMTQDLIWEQYPYPVDRQILLAGNSYAMIFSATPVTRISPPEAPRPDVWINKTGSTNGFGAYVAFIPAKRLGIVILANKDYPIDARVTAAYRVLTALAASGRPMPNPPDARAAARSRSR